MGLLADTARLLDDLPLDLPAVVVDEARARANIAAMNARANASGVRLRPHFKTHANVGVGRWFREAGIRQATVSSLAMARQFAGDGWHDLTLARLIDPRELPQLAALAHQLADVGGGLGLVVDTPETAAAVRCEAGPSAPLWLKVDTGYGRSGVVWNDVGRLRAVAGAADFTGLLTHAGHSYHTPGAQLPALFAETAERLAAAREAIGADLQLSVGDTPTCTVVDRFAGVDEVRPGNFIFYDLMQMEAGVCSENELAAALACPVLAVDAARKRLVLHGGAVHLSKEALATGAGPIYGRLGTATTAGFGRLCPEAVVTSLTQEHGIVTVDPPSWDALTAGLQPGDRVLVFPVHICLTCHQQDAMVTLQGTLLPRYAPVAPI